MTKAGKVWGVTELLEANGVLEFHRIQMNKGGICSKHLHEYKWNGFYVESGVMLVRVWQKDYDLIDETILYAGDYTKVKPGLYHQFECLESGVAFELYWAEFSHNDIKRESVGYLDENSDASDVHFTSNVHFGSYSDFNPQYLD
jgi:mannose-6-phosphate isomerase-like protein (cupin superfamily)